MVWPVLRRLGECPGRRTMRSEVDGTTPVEPRKRGPRRSCIDAELTGRIRHEIAVSPFTGEGHRKFWARLRVAGVRTSKTRVLRLMREAELLASMPSDSGRQEGPHRDHHHRSPESDVGHRRHGNRDGRRRLDHRVRRHRPLHGRVCGHSCRQASAALRGPGATPARGP